MSDCLYIVIPCYNEQGMISETALQLKKKVNFLKAEGKIAEQSKIVFVNDGSRNKTWSIIQELHKQDPLFLCNLLALPILIFYNFIVTNSRYKKAS